MLRKSIKYIYSILQPLILKLNIQPRSLKSSSEFQQLQGKKAIKIKMIIVLYPN